MDQNERDYQFEKTLEESRALLTDASRVAEKDYEFSLEGILAEYGAESVKVTPEEPKPPEEPEPPEPQSEEADAAGGIGDIVPEVDTPQSYSLQQVVERTVQDALDEQRTEPVLEERPERRPFFRRARGGAAGEGRPAKDADEPPEEEPEEPREPEPPLRETVAEYRAAASRAATAARLVTLLTALMWLPAAAERLGWMPERYAADVLLNTAPFLAALALCCLLGREVFVLGAVNLRKRRVSYELLASLLCLAALGDTALCLFYEPRMASAAQPMHSVAALALCSALWGRALRCKALLDTLRTAAIGDAPYVVTTTAGGAAKRRGSLDGFSRTARRDDVSGHWQTVLLPVVLTGALVFSVLATVQVGSWALWCWNLSAILAGGGTLAFPLVYALPLRRVTRRLTKSGTALAGYQGAASLRRSNCIVLTDSDLFPPGTYSLSGLRIFGEESGKVFAYAATMARASETGVSRLFDKLLAQQDGKILPVSDFNFEEGGVGGTIEGESVLFGTAAFCRKMGVTLPAGLKDRTGLYLVVDGTLIAVFMVKYMAAANVDWAVRAIARAHITPVLAVRDGNITPALLKRVFGTDAGAVYPQLSTRLALSQKDSAKPCAVIYREGLMPYAELAVGAKRLCYAVRAGNVISLIASAAGTMLAFYFSFLGAYDIFTPANLTVVLALLALSSLIDAMFVDKY